MSAGAASQLALFDAAAFPARMERYPRFRYMGSKHRLLPWLHQVLGGLEFESALDAFSGSGCVSYLLKAMGKQVHCNDFLRFAHQIAKATVENSQARLSQEQCRRLVEHNPRRSTFIEDTFQGIFFTKEDLRFLDNVWSNLEKLPSARHRALALTCLFRSCLKRQPRGVFTVAGDPERYKDGRRDLRLSLKEHFLESVEAFNRVVFDNGSENEAHYGDIFELDLKPDLVYMDPPYVPRSDDNCYIKRYHFLEGLASYWNGDGTEIMEDTKVKKIPKRYTPFSYRKTACDAFDRLFERFADSILVLSYSSNGFPDLDKLVETMERYKSKVEVCARDHRYHFGTHNRVSPSRNSVREYLIVGTER